MIRSTNVVGETTHLRGASASLRTLTVRVCLVSLAAQLSVAAESLTLRQFDASRSPLIDIAAQVDTRLATEQVDVLELKVDQRTPVAATKSVALVPAPSLLAAKDYAYRRPVCNVFFTFAGTSPDIAGLADSLDFAAAFRAAFSDVQLRAVQLYVLDPVQGKMLVCATPEQAAEAMVAQAEAFAALQPEGILNKAASLFKSTQWLPIDQVAEEVRSFAAKDPAAKNALAHTLVVFWAGGPEDDVKKVDKRAFLHDNVIVTIGEIVGSSEFAVERARPFCRETYGSFLSKRDLRLPKGKIDYACVISAAIDAWKRRTSDRFLLSAQSANLDETEKCWFEVGIPGTSVRQTVACSRDPGPVGDSRKQHLSSLQSRFDALIAKAEFRSALDLIPDLRRFGADAVSLQSAAAEAWKVHILALADKGEHAAALQDVDALHGTRLTSQTEQASLREEVHFRSGQWAALEAKDQNRAMDLLTRWRELARQSGSYEKQKPRAAGVALQMARYLATDVGKDAEFAREINELRRVDADQARGEACITLLRGWITRNGERFDVSARLALLEDWGMVLPTLSSETRGVEAIRRFFVLATSDKQARDILMGLRAESLSKDALVAGYVSLNRALVLAHPLATALKSAADLRVESTRLAELLNRALTGLNDREAAFYRAGEGLAGQYLLTDDAVRIVSTRLDDYGYGIRLHPSFNRRLHDAGVTAVLEGIEGERPVCVVLLPMGAESFIRIAFSDRTAPAVQREFKTAKAQAAGKPQNEAMNICLNILDVRDAELAAHLGAEVFGQLISHVSISAFVRGGGRESLRAFHAAVPKGVQGFVIVDRLASREGALVREADQSIHCPDSLPEDVNLDRRISGAAYALWEKPYFEIGIPLRDEGERRVSGILRVGLRSVPR